MDEPTAGLDPNERIRFEIWSVNCRKTALSCCLPTLCQMSNTWQNEIILMKEGKFFYTGTSDEIIFVYGYVSMGIVLFLKKELNNYMKYLTGNVRTVADGVELRVLSKTLGKECSTGGDNTGGCISSVF